jgi:hypothetical protein
LSSRRNEIAKVAKDGLELLFLEAEMIVQPLFCNCDLI